MANFGGVFLCWRSHYYLFWATFILSLDSCCVQSVSQPGHHLNPDQMVQELSEKSQIKTEAEHSSQQPSNSQYSLADSATSDDNNSPLTSPPNAPPTAPPTNDPTIVVPVEELPLPEPPLREEEGKSNEELGETRGRDEMQGRSEGYGSNEVEGADEGEREGGGGGRIRSGRDEGEGEEEATVERTGKDDRGSGQNRLDKDVSNHGEDVAHGAVVSQSEGDQTRTATLDRNKDRESRQAETGTGAMSVSEAETVEEDPVAIQDEREVAEVEKKVGDGTGDIEDREALYEGKVTPDGGNELGKARLDSKEPDANNLVPELGPDEEKDDSVKSGESEPEKSTDETCSPDSCPGDISYTSDEEKKVESKEEDIKEVKVVAEKEACGELGCKGGDQVEEVKGKDGDSKDNEKDEEEDDQVLTFEEFKKKHLEQGGGQVGQRPPDQGAAGSSSAKKTTLTNYASVDCGAKVVEANPEAQNTMAILHENMDMYMINPCKANISFVVELCEVVSVRTIEIACFELFSSIPKTFRVYSSESLSDGEWISQGEFQVPNERIIHSIPLVNDEHVYAKFIKVEMLSHYGREHFCPLSLLRVLGASMMEVYEESRHNPRPPPGTTQTPVTLPPSEGFGEEDILTDNGESSSEDNGTLLDAAKDAVMSVLNRPLSLLNKMNGLMKPEQGKPLPDQPDASSKPGSLDPASPGEGGLSGGEDSGSREEETSRGQAKEVEPEEENGGGRPIGSAQDDQSSVGQEQHCNEGDTSCTTRKDDPGQNEEEASAEISGVGVSGDQRTGISQQDQSSSVLSIPTTADIDHTSLTSNGGVASSQPGSTLNPAQTGSTLSATTNAIRPTPASTSNPTPDLESKPLGLDLGPAEVDLDPVSLPSVEVRGQDKENGAVVEEKRGGRYLTDSQIEESATTFTGAGQDKIGKESESDQVESSRTTKDNDPHHPVSGALLNTRNEGTQESDGASSEHSVERGHSDAPTAAPSTSTGSSPLTAPKSIDTDVHPDIASMADVRHIPVTNSVATYGVSQLDSADTLSSTLISPTPSLLLPPAKDSLSLKSDGSANNTSQKTAEESSNVTTDCANHQASSSSVPDPVSGTNSPPNSDSGVLNSSCSSNGTACNLDGSENPHENGNQTDYKSDSHSLDTVNNTNESYSASPLNRNETSHQNASQLDTNVTRNGNQTSNGLHSGSEYKGLPLPAQQKERSVFLRLSNHMEELDSNMTLFSIFLDQISSSLKKNKNKTDETSKWLERRITTLNASIAALREQVYSRGENVSEYRQELLEVMEVVSATIVHFGSRRSEFMMLAEVIIILLVVLTLLLIVLLLWQCHGHRKLHREMRLLKKAFATSAAQLPASLPGSRVESVGGALSTHPGAHHCCVSSHSDTSISSGGSAGASLSKHSRSSSASRLSDIASTSNGYGAKGSGVGVVIGNGRGMHNGQPVDHTPHSFNSILTSLQHSDTNKENEWILSTDKKRRKSKGNRKT